MSFLKRNSKTPKPDSYTFIFVPGKYGSSKTFNLSRRFILLFAGIITLLFLCIFSAAINYFNIKKQNIKSLDTIKALESVNKTQLKEISNFKQNAQDIESTLQELKNLEEKLKKKLDINSPDNNPTTSNLNTEDISGLLQVANNEIDNIYLFLDSMDKRIDELRYIPAIFPCSGNITSYFGGRKDPISRGHVEYHKAIDISNSYGTKIRASADGIVIHAGWYYGYGQLVMIDHGNGYVTLYGHNSKILIKNGQRVKKGQLISLMGSTGKSTGTHVHFEIRKNGIPIDPLKVIRGGL